MSPGGIRHVTNTRHGLREKGVSLHGFRASQLTGIDIRPPGVTRGVGVVCADCIGDTGYSTVEEFARQALGT